MDIFEACRVGDLDAVRKYVGNGADVNLVDNDGYSALIWAACNGHLGVCELLVGSGADVNIVDIYGDRETVEGWLVKTFLTV